MIIAVDPGPIQSAWVVYAGAGSIWSYGIEPNAKVLERLLNDLNPEKGCLVVEMIASYGMPVGKEVFETCVWIGRFIQAWQGQHTKLYRKQVCMQLCHSARAKDSNIRQALIDRMGPPGTKKNPGKTYGISKDLWSALAVAVTYDEIRDVLNAPDIGL